jgi:tetratricopeptide (TPR) repeat protein
MATDKQIEKLRALSKEIDDLYAAGDKTGGAALLERALKEAEAIDPAYALFFQGEQAGYVQKDVVRQETFFRDSIARRKSDYYLLRNLGVVLAKQGKYDEAIDCYDRAFSQNGNDYVALMGKGVALGQLGKHQESLEWTDKALKLNPGNVDASVNRAWSLYHLNKREEALRDIGEIVKANPGHDYAQRAYSYLNVLHGKTPAPATTPDNQSQQMDDLKAVVERVRKKFSSSVAEILEKMDESTQHINDFLKAESQFRDDQALFFILRKWNSYTPCIPREDGERSIGGGYYFLVNGVGTVVDPGYNFLENFNRIGGRITDIRNIVITHAHNDHTADLESILSLVYKYNDDKVLREPRDPGFKSVQLFLNAGCQMKFSGLLDLRGADYLEDVQTLMPGHSYDMCEGLTLRALHAYHDEVVAKHYAVGLDFTLENKGGEATRVVITADTGLFPQTKDRKADTKGKEIWELYGLKPGDTHLLIPHLGSVKEKEFTASLTTDPQEVFYPNHLGLMGTVRVIERLRPELAVVSEFGEELKDFQARLVEMIAKCVQKFQPEPRNRTVVLPGDLTFMYDLRKRSVYCVASAAAVRPSATLKADVQKVRGQQDLFYYYTASKLKMTSLSSVARRFEDELSKRDLLFIHKPKVTPKAAKAPARRRKP